MSLSALDRHSKCIDSTLIKIKLNFVIRVVGYLSEYAFLLNPMVVARGHPKVKAMYGDAFKTCN